MPVMLPGESVVPEISFCAFDAANVGESLFSSNACSPSGIGDPGHPNRELQASTDLDVSSLTSPDEFTDPEPASSSRIR